MKQVLSLIFLVTFSTFDNKRYSDYQSFLRILSFPTSRIQLKQGQPAHACSINPANINEILNPIHNVNAKIIHKSIESQQNGKITNPCVESSARSD